LLVEEIKTKHVFQDFIWMKKNLCIKKKKRKANSPPSKAQSVLVKLQKHNGAHRIKVFPVLGLGSALHSFCPNFTSHFCL